jgi:hypothetical protein
MNVSVPSRAPMSPPVTGASTNLTPALLSCCAIAFASTGPIVPWSIISASGATRFFQSRFAANKTDRRAGPSVTQEQTTWLPCSASSTVRAIVQPCEAARSSPGLGDVRFQIVTRYPAFARLLAIAAPIVPAPIQAIFVSFVVMDFIAHASVFVVASGQFTSANEKTRLFVVYFRLLAVLAPARTELTRLQTSARLGEIGK